MRDAAVAAHHEPSPIDCRPVLEYHLEGVISVTSEESLFVTDTNPQKRLSGIVEETLTRIGQSAEEEVSGTWAYAGTVPGNEDIGKSSTTIRELRIAPV